MAQKTLELLESIMAGHKVAQPELDDLLGKREPEGLHLDYKDGKELENKKQAARTIREYLSAFANSAGGILLVGVDERKWKVTGCPAPGGGDLRKWMSKGDDLQKWASRCLTPIAHHFSPPPLFDTVDHRDGQVLVAATARSSNLVFCVEEAEPVYYLRIHDQTLKAPAYLVSDLVLGRRQYPYLRITDLRLSFLDTILSPEDIYDLVLCLACTVENEGLSTAEDVRVGVVSRVKHSYHRPTNYLLSHIEVREPPVELEAHNLVHDVGRRHPQGSRSIEPFTSGLFLWDRTPYLLPLRKYAHWHTPYVWKAAVYLVTEDAPPVWYQLSLAVGTDLLEHVKSNKHELSSESDLLGIERVSGTRPIVAWNGFRPFPK